MDWKYILSLSPDNLSDEDKDSLINTVAWFDCDSEKIDNKKCVALIKLSQEILKYKSEQVETLLAELDELAARQGEEEARKQENNNKLKLKSHGSEEYDELKQKYSDLKSKYKQQMNVNESQNKNLEKAKKRIISLEQEKLQMENELRSVHRDDESQSDLSETVKEQHQQLIQNVHQKNQQLSLLLNDIEAADTENVLLREKLSDLQNELSDATKQLTVMANEKLTFKVQLEEKLEIIENFTQESEALRSEIRELTEEKQQHDSQIDEFASAIDTRMDEWKKLLEIKDNEIKELQNKQISQSSQSSEIEFSGSNDKFHISVLNKALTEREDQIQVLQEQLQTATKEMEDSTEVLQRLTAERDSDARRAEELLSLSKGLKMQLKAAHVRCQDLQDGVAYKEKLLDLKQKDIDNILTQLREDGQVDLSDLLKNIQQLNDQNRAKDKKITDYVKIANKLQSSVQKLECENSLLREKLGVSDEDIQIGEVTLKQKQQRKEMQNLKNQIKTLEEQKLQRQFDNIRLNRTVSTLSNQIEELGIKPVLDNKNLMTGQDVVDETIGKNNKDVSREQYVAVVEENDALRKGMHEILESINQKNEATERKIKSETLQKLLRALDVKHISGWYHPAMRLQAELHASQGANDELREQLRITRIELSKYKQMDKLDMLQTELGEDLPTETEFAKTASPTSIDIISNLNRHLLEILDSYRQEEQKNSQLVDKLKEYNQEFIIIQQQINVLYRQYTAEKKSWKEQTEKYENDNRNLEGNVEVLQAKLKEFSNLGNEEFDKVQHLAEMSAKLVILNRKCVFLEDNETKLTKKVAKLTNELECAGQAAMLKINKLSTERKAFTKKLEIMEILMEKSVHPQTFLEVQNNLDNTTIKYRELLKNFNNIKDEYTKEISVLNETVKSYTNEKSELQRNLFEALSKLHAFENIASNNEAEALSKKLAECEVREVVERQRANHMNNLYELVKEQLQKSENRFTELEKCSQDITQKNLILQQHMKTLEDKLVHFTDVNELNEMSNKYTKLLEEIETFSLKNVELTQQISLLQKTPKVREISASTLELEILSLKHQILDLQSIGDDKALIARLSSDVVHARISESEFRKKLDQVTDEMKEYQDACESSNTLLEQEKLKNEKILSHFEEKTGVLKCLIRYQRRHYLGCIPLTSKEKFASNLWQLHMDKQQAFLNLQNAQEYENECHVLKDCLNTEINLLNDLKSNLGPNLENQLKIINDWYQERGTIQLNELKSRRETEFKDMQLKQALQRLQAQEEQISNLEEELLKSFQKLDSTNIDDTKNLLFNKTPQIISDASQNVKITNSMGTQTTSESPPMEITPSNALLHTSQTETLNKTAELIQLTTTQDSDQQSNMQMKESPIATELVVNDNIIQSLKSKITELEMNISLFRTQIGDKQSQITFYEKHIMELQNKMSEFTCSIDNNTIQNNQDVSVLNTTITDLQLAIAKKEELILKYQTLLKKDRDEHSLAAARMQDELKRLQSIIVSQQEAYKELKDAPPQVETHPGRAAIEQYVLQVHALEKHTTDLHTSVSSLNSQLQASRQEAVRWRTLANERLEKMELLRKDLEGQHQNEILIYKNESEKWQEEVYNLKLFLSKHKNDFTLVEPDLKKNIKDKDDKIHELTVTLRQLRNEVKKNVDKCDVVMSPKLSELETLKDQLLKEHDTLKKRYEQVLNREKSAKEEIRNLKDQLMKRPISAKNERSDKASKEQLQKKISSLEKEIDGLREKLDREMNVNETHKMRVSEDFEKWKKQKHWQQTAEKLKIKLKEKTDEYDKLYQTCAGYRILIERLEREKYNMETKFKNMQSNHSVKGSSNLEILVLENEKLRAEMEVLNSKLQMQHHHSGGLGAAMLQDKLETQERKIAVLELTSKGTVEVRTELERLQSTVTNLQKINLRLEAENLERKLDVEKYEKDIPHLREQIQHLENYIEVLKSENRQHIVTESGDQEVQSTDSKKVSELERTVFVLKRVVEKLQAENKRLQSGNRSCTLNDRFGSLEKSSAEFRRLKDQYGESIQKIARLEEELRVANSKIKSLENKPAAKELSALMDELSRMKSQLSEKSLLLDKVKVLLHRAATKERGLQEEVASLKLMLPSSSTPEKSSSKKLDI